jgi:hypothetical protein
MTIQRTEIETLHRVVGNLEPIPFALKKLDGTAYDLTGKAVVIRMVLISSGAVKINNSACVIESAAAGTGYYQPVTADMDTAGKYAIYVLDNSVPPRRFPYDGARLILNLMAETQQQQ